MSEPEYVLAWEQLREWTVWLIGRYRLVLEDRLPGCWPQHPELIEELWALRAWRAEAYGPDGTGQSAVYWHQALVAFLGHVSAWWAGGCRAGHTDPATELTAQQTDGWARADPLAGIPQPMRPATQDLNVLTDPQMRALTNTGLARPQHEHVTAFTFYDGSWWAFASPETDEEQALWFRADDSELPNDPSFTQIPGDNQ